MSDAVYPYIFETVYKDHLWGGDRIGRTFSCRGVGRCAESWEIAAHPDGDTTIRNGCPSHGRFTNVFGTRDNVL